MSSTLRQRILITLLPLLILVAVLGSAGVWLLHRLGDSIDVILRENYESVVAMQDLKESLERIDSSFQFMLVADKLTDPKERHALEEKARHDFDQNWKLYRVALGKERDNITILPTEQTLFESLAQLTERYDKQGQEFQRRALKGKISHQDYYGGMGLYETFGKIKRVADDILQLNQQEMVRASDQAKSSARSSTLWRRPGRGYRPRGAVCLAYRSYFLAADSSSNASCPGHQRRQPRRGRPLSRGP
jgi:two-component system, NtrC family, sensor histidine kinase KinB